MVVVGLFAKVGRNGAAARMDELRGQVPRPYKIIEHEADGCRDDSREQRVGDGVAEDTSRIFLPAEHRQRGDDGKKDSGNGDKLEQPRVDRRHKVHQIVKPCQAQCAQDGILIGKCRGRKNFFLPALH